MKLSWKREILALALLVAMAIIAIHYYSVLPARIPDHFNPQGKPDEWTGKIDFFLLWGAYLVVPYVLLTFFPFLDPLRNKVGNRLKILLLVRDLLLVTFAVLFVVNIVMTAESRFGVNWLGLAIGVFLIIYGNYLPRIPQNWSVGMKTRWTLSSEIVWKRTQILGGWLTATLGIIFIAFTVLRLSISIPVLLVIPVAVIIEVYSYITYKKASRVNVAKT